jgi:hypothetical protein
MNTKDKIARAMELVRLTVTDSEQNIKCLMIDVVGSTMITGEIGEDIDVLCLVPNVGLEEVGFPGWEYGGSVGEHPDNDRWGSWKRYFGDIGVTVNMLLVTDSEYYIDWLQAAEVCKLLHLVGVPINKRTRIGIHNIIMDGEDAESEFDCICPTASTQK